MFQKVDAKAHFVEVKIGKNASPTSRLFSKHCLLQNCIDLAANVVPSRLLVIYYYFSSVLTSSHPGSTLSLLDTDTPGTSRGDTVGMLMGRLEPATPQFELFVVALLFVDKNFPGDRRNTVDYRI